MSKGQMLKHLVQERLTVAAEEVFALFENAIAEYEEELCRFRERDLENHQDFPTLMIHSVHGGDAPYLSSPSPVHPGIFWSAHIKEEPEEQIISQGEPDILQAHVPQLDPVFVKNEEFLQVQQGQGDRGETREEDSSDTDNDDDWGPIQSVNTNFEGRNHSEVQSKDQRKPTRNRFLPRKSKSARKKSDTVHKEDESKTGKAAEKEKHQCNICKKTFEKVKGLKIHVKVIHREDQRKAALNGVDLPKTKSAAKKSDTVPKEDHPPKTKSVTKKSDTVLKEDHPPKTKSAAKKSDKGENSGADGESELNNYQCHICKKTFDKLRGLKLHVKIHSSDRPYGCPFCEKCFTRRDSLKSHIRTHTGEKPFTCLVCNKSFADLSNQRKHERTHDHIGSLKCGFCRKKFTIKENLKLHIYREHRGEKATDSSISEQTSANTTSLKSRKKSNTGEDQVNESQVRSESPKPKEIHEDRKTYTCSYCSKTFSCKSNLDVHTRIHTGEKPYTCPFCDRKFAHKSTLHVHKRVHTGEKPFQCLICKKAFTARPNLISHKRTHTSGQPFTCPFCDETFAEKSDRNSHIKAHHTTNSESDD